jgi:sodium/bile acid cotransporter 7
MTSLFSTLSKAGLNGFFFCLIAVVALAFQFPEWGATDSYIPLSDIAQYGVSVIFFFYGLKLSPAKLKAGLYNWRLHVLIQSSTFIFFPILILLVHYVFGNETNDLLWLGVFYVAALPSTVSSSVVMVSIAGGNMSAAIFNASISSILGVFVTPIWMSLFIGEMDAEMDTTQVIIKLCFQVLVPVIIGLSLHKWLGHLAERFKAPLRLFDQTIILLIVFTSFCESVSGKMFEQVPVKQILFLGAAMLLLFFSMFAIMYVFSLLLKLNKEDRIAVLFCGSKKSLVQGAVMGKALFPDPVMLGVVLLPLMLYHALQLVTSSIIAESMAGNK